jgi:hypothetical protein
MEGSNRIDCKLVRRGLLYACLSETLRCILEGLQIELGYERAEYLLIEEAVELFSDLLRGKTRNAFCSAGSRSFASGPLLKVFIDVFLPGDGIAEASTCAAMRRKSDAFSSK